MNPSLIDLEIYFEYSLCSLQENKESVLDFYGNDVLMAGSEEDGLAGHSVHGNR